MVRRLGIAVSALLILMVSTGCYSGESGDRIRVHVVGDTGTTVTVVVLILIFVAVLWIGISIHERIRETRDVMKNIRDTSPAWRQHLSDEEERLRQEEERRRQEKERRQQEKEYQRQEIAKLSNWNPKKWMWYLIE